ncbi:Riboflavin synthase [Zhongshania aliphaticivorans]|uniref:Riboflavin synthase n=1 Tax=Zhongshania aliphaticivorans TaxID=1470434 RepID=A0A5S9MU07_9GAMM|nr:riboflavin synthase [Zhongshania aliphaticivorans]CAA0079526.1 Riboflavin synthase [Zhongshania aliphaticivorans]CAA0086149.1 Riboflavin synthase [Zhongshania aliphaticivorans]
MFTGIIEAVGTIAATELRGGDMRVQISSASLPMAEVKLGDSIASNGVCLTVVSILADGFWADVSNETLSLSTFAKAKVGQSVNLERAMLASSRLDGHIVSGHVDGVGSVLSCVADARSIRLAVEAPKSIEHYIASKGSICIDGVSLTVNKVNGNVLELNIVPHTAAETIIQHYRVGTEVNLEVDVVARYLERLLQAKKPADSGISMATLAENGFLKGRS